MVIRNPNDIVYPSSDGKPMAENTIQFRWITIIKGGMDVVFKDDANVFVAGDLLWYPVEGDPSINAAPDTMLVFGRPKGDRMSYLQWREDNLPPQVVFEVYSPSNTESDKAAKLEWYEQFGVDEYYTYDPDRLILQGWIRKGSVLRGVRGMRDGFTSPRTGVILKMEEELVLLGPDGYPFVDYPVLAEQRDEFRREVEQQRQEVRQVRVELSFAESRTLEEYNRANQEHERAEEHARQAEEERQRAEEFARRADEERQRAEEERQRAADHARQAEEERQRAAEFARRADEERQRAEAAIRELEQMRELLRQRGSEPNKPKTD